MRICGKLRKTRKFSAFFLRNKQVYSKVQEENKSNNEVCEEILGKREKSQELFENCEKKLFSPKIQGLSQKPQKYFHKIKTHSLIIDKSAANSSNFLVLLRKSLGKALKSAKTRELEELLAGFHEEKHRKPQKQGESPEKSQ